MLRLFPILLATLIPLAAQDRSIDVERSTVTIHVGKAGLLSAAGHEHWVTAPISSGAINDSNAPRVEFTVETAKMRVKPDPKVDAKTEAQIQKDMEEMTLETARYREIAFQSSHIEKAAEGEWRVDGTLSLHGVSKPMEPAQCPARWRRLHRTHYPQADRFRDQADQHRRRRHQGEERNRDRVQDLRASLK